MEGRGVGRARGRGMKKAEGGWWKRNCRRRDFYKQERLIEGLNVAVNEAVYICDTGKGREQWEGREPGPP